MANTKQARKRARQAVARNQHLSAQPPSRPYVN